MVSSAKHEDNLRFRNLILQCCSLLARSWQIYLVDCYREANMIANKLANLIVVSPVHLVFLPTPPVQVLGHLQWDMQGGSTPRIVLWINVFLFRYLASYVPSNKKK
ncbi:hypothetical protein MANES_04G074750v8 [Manihot esculenta]|uniref:Uncharacterized protein n=1 Tax=Manihot esculenta TaxID=3983 RepID=A0ACB7HTI2_MANES|nr:hypothetical protein MANES_04G074750v8 [Manihot esculenta]